jgi:GT2 family glycosyltransferase
MEASGPAVSVVVCTRDRPDSLGPTLDSLAAQSHRAYEVLVVDQSRSDVTRAMLTERGESDSRFRYLRLAEPGLSRAYNAGIGATSGPILAFTDDDCTAPADWLESIERAFDQHPDVELLYGQVLLPSELEARENLDGFTPSLPIPRRRVLSRRRGFQVFGMGANFAARRRLFERVGPFDEVLGGGGPLESSQDFDFVYRVYRDGGATLLEPDVVVRHHGFRSHTEWPATVRSYGIGVGGFYLKHVRAGDLYAARLLAAYLAVWSARSLRRWTRRGRSKADWSYVGNLFAGMRRSFQFDVDRRRRLYEPRRPATKEGR